MISRRNKWINRFVVLLSGGLMGCCITVCFALVSPPLFILYAYVTDQPTSLSLDKVILTTDLDEDGLPVDQVSKFNPSIPRIYGVIILQSPVGLPLDGTLWVRWYYEDEQIAAHYLHPDPRRHMVMWIEPPEGEEFYLGQYRMDIYLDRLSVRTIAFEVE